MANVTRLLESKNFESFEAFSEALGTEYELSYRPGAVKILSYPDGNLAAVWGEQGINDNPAEEPKKLFYASAGKDVSEEIAKLNVVINTQFDGMKISKPFIDSNNDFTIVFVVAERIDDDFDDGWDDIFDDDDDDDGEE